MKKAYIYIITILSLFMSSSCDEQLNINTDPLAATSADPNAILPYVIVQYSNRKITELGTRISDVPQYISACYNSPRNGATTSFLTGNNWFMFYNQMLGNLILVEQDAIEAGATSNNVAAIAKTLRALAFYELTCIWESVPFTEALDGAEFPQPAFDDQQTILNGVVSMLDEAMELIDTQEANGAFDVSVGDLIYNGDLDKWRRFANSLKLRALMLLRNGGASVDSQIATCISEPLISESAHTAYLAYETGPSTMNAWQNIIEAFFGGTNESSFVHGAGVPLVDILETNNDPRYNLFISDPSGGGSPGVGIFPGSDEAVIANNIIRRDLPDIWYTASETHLYLAELALDGVSTPNTATEHFQTGVTRALEWWGRDVPGAIVVLTSAEISGYAATLGTPTANDIYEQQFLDAFMRPVLSWTHVRRNGWPELDPPAASNISTILKRFTYPPDEAGANSKTPANKATDVPMWFENL